MDRKAANLIRDVFETQCEVFFVFNGTAANSLALASMCQSYHSILCHETAHVESDECGAPEFSRTARRCCCFPGENGKIDPPAIERMVKRRTDIHYPKPRVVSVTQATELGTVYTVEELKGIWSMCKKLNLRMHMDGARFANAVASLKVAPKEITWQAGVDVLCFGGTKTARRSETQSCFSIPTWRASLIIAASRPGSWLPKCAFCPRPGWGCCRMAHGCAMPLMPMPWPALLEEGLREISEIKHPFSAAGELGLCGV